MTKFCFLFLFLAISLSLSQAHAADGKTVQPGPGQRPVVYVMPNALVGPGASENPQIVEGSSHDGKEPQVAMIYKELQHRKECQPFVENIIKDKANYFFLLQHGGGKGNRWAVSDPNGNVIASGDSLFLGNSVKDACVAMAKDWQQRGGGGK
jgi:hypothetical protein